MMQVTVIRIEFDREVDETVIDSIEQYAVDVASLVGAHLVATSETVELPEVSDVQAED
jgi:hypothetical protein